MDEQRLAQVLERAVTGIDPPDRLDEITAPPPGARPPRRGAAVLAIAASVAVGLAVVAAWHAAGPDRGQVVRSDQLASTTTTPAPAVRVGQRITVDGTTLPFGVRFLDESTNRTKDLLLVARFSRSNGRWEGGGPYLRLSVRQGRGVGRELPGSPAGGAPTLQIDGHDAYVTVDTPPGAPADAADPAFTGAWVTVAWATSDDEVRAVQGKGVSRATLEAIARSMAVDGR